MKETKRCICNFSFYDQHTIQEKLEDMAQKGWFLEKTGSFLWTYRRGAPKQLRFCVTYFPAASEFDPAPTEGELTKLDYCRQDGWELVARWGGMQIFSSENPDAVPIETEPVDPSPWGLDGAYQLQWDNDVLNGYLFFKGNRIVELTFYWEPTAEQLEQTARALFGD